TSSHANPNASSSDAKSNSSNCAKNITGRRSTRSFSTTTISENPRHSAKDAADPLLRVLPSQRRQGDGHIAGNALAPARTAPLIHLLHLRRRRLDARPHARSHAQDQRTIRPRSYGAFHLRRPTPHGNRLDPRKL